MPSYKKDSKKGVLVNRYLTAQTIKPGSKWHFSLSFQPDAETAIAEPGYCNVYSGIFGWFTLNTSVQKKPYLEFV
jgi:hypothetical protein